MTLIRGCAGLGPQMNCLRSHGMTDSNAGPALSPEPVGGHPHQPNPATACFWQQSSVGSRPGPLVCLLSLAFSLLPQSWVGATEEPPAHRGWNIYYLRANVCWPLLCIIFVLGTPHSPGLTYRESSKNKLCCSHILSRANIAPTSLALSWQRGCLWRSQRIRPATLTSLDKFIYYLSTSACLFKAVWWPPLVHLCGGKHHTEMSSVTAISQMGKEAALRCSGTLYLIIFNWLDITIKVTSNVLYP